MEGVHLPPPYCRHSGEVIGLYCSVCGRKVLRADGTPISYVDLSSLLQSHQDALREQELEKEDAPAASWLKKNTHPWLVP